jgi:glycine cleavage system H protein
MTAQLKFSKDHEWIFLENEDTAVLGITEYAQHALGDLVYVELPKMGAHYKKGAHCAVVESVKTAAEVYTPVTGDIVAVNDSLSGDPEILKQSIETGWICKIKMTNKDEVASLMSDDDYQSYLKTL